MKKAHLLSSLSTAALITAVGAVTPAFAVVPNCSFDDNCVYGITNNTDTATALNGYSNPVVFAADGTLNVGNGIDIWYFNPASVNTNYDYVWDQTSMRWRSSSSVSAGSITDRDALLTTGGGIKRSGHG